MGSVAGINNLYYINNLYNGQGAGNVNGALTFTGYLPENYGIILGPNASTYGKLSASNVGNWDTNAGSGNGTGTTNFSIYSGPVKSTRYVGVITGVDAALLTSSTLTGNYTSGATTYAYQLSLQDAIAGIWDLLFPTYVGGPNTADTQASLEGVASALKGTYSLQTAVLANSLYHDCTVFDNKGVCLSTGGRYTSVQGTNGLNNSSGLLIAAYRLRSGFRAGAYVDQNVSTNNPSGIVKLGNEVPLFGVFGAWNQAQDGTGTEIKVSAAWGQKNTTVTRQVVGTSEAGSGASQLSSRGIQAVAKYGMNVASAWLVSPYAGLRHARVNMGGYTEASTGSVTAPLTYADLNMNTTTVLAGVEGKYRFSPKLGFMAAAGFERDVQAGSGVLNATGVAGISAISFNANPVRNRLTATLGTFYDIGKNQRLALTGIYRQEIYRSLPTTTVLATYTVGM